MSNICRRCGHLVQFGLVPLNPIGNGYCLFCIREFKALTDKLDKEREKNLEAFKKSVVERMS